MTSKARASAIPDRSKARLLLDTEWSSILLADDTETTQEINNLVNSKYVSVRYCLITQLLGKLVAPELDILCLQKREGAPGQWDPRGFSTDVIVPWIQANQNVLGRSDDPYVSKPLRRPRLDQEMDRLSGRSQWESLCKILAGIQCGNDPLESLRVFRMVLSAIRNRLRDLTFNYAVPQRISLHQVERLVESFLAERSGGDRGLAVAAALFQTLGEKYHIYTGVRRNVINASDTATNAPADLECIGSSGETILAVEVKERTIGDADVRIAVEKARTYSVREFLFCTEGIQTGQQMAIELSFASAWASGTNIYQVEPPRDFRRLQLSSRLES